MYDPNKDTVVHKLGIQKDKKDAGQPFLRIRIYSYDGGPAKVGLERIMIDKDGNEKFLKLGRLTLEEMDFVAEKITKFRSKNPATKAA